MKYTIASIPTMYSGVSFRSRLEAKWARFFDICGWRWTYEPLDLDGWIPDFSLDIGRPVLVEVKPYTTALEMVVEMQAKDRLTTLDLLCVGATLIPADAFGLWGYGFGVHLQTHDPEINVEDRHGTGLALLTYCPECRAVTFYNSTHTPVCAASGCLLGANGWSLLPDFELTEETFKVAGNDTQWKKVGQRG